MNFVKEYWNNVFSEFLQKIQEGMTPNPDILCNIEIKFDALLKHAMSQGFDYLATGSICIKTSQTESESYKRSLCSSWLAPWHSWTEKSSFAKRIRSRERSKLFPLRCKVWKSGESIISCWKFKEGFFDYISVLRSEFLREPKCAKLRKKLDLLLLTRRIVWACVLLARETFVVSSVHLNLNTIAWTHIWSGEYITNKSGSFVTETGTIVGTHDGLHLYTVGQRAKISGAASR